MRARRFDVWRRARAALIVVEREKGAEESLGHGGGRSEAGSWVECSGKGERCE